MKSKTHLYKNTPQLNYAVPALKQAEEALVCLSFYQMWNNPRCGCYNRVNEGKQFFWSD